jgi:hypothetical protein
MASKGSFELQINNMGDEGTVLGQPKDLFDRRGVRLTLYLIIPAVIFVLVCSGIRVSQYGINHTILVFGQKEMLSGGPAAIRISLVADDGRFFLPDSLTGYLARGGGRDLLFKGFSTDGGYALACNFRVPKIAPGPAVLEIDIRFADKRRVVRTPIEIVSKPSVEEAGIPEDASNSPGPDTALKGENEIEIYTEDRGAPTGLTSVLFVRSQKPGGEPVSESLEYELLADSNKQKEKKTLLTDGLGLFAFPIKPLELSYPVRLVNARPLTEAERWDAGPVEDTRGAVLFPRVVYAGITCQLHNPIVSPGSPIRVSVSQISQSGPVYADIFQDGRWVQATSSWLMGGRADLEIRPLMTGLGRLQITTSALAPGRTIAVRHFYVLKSEENYNDGLRAVLRMLESSDEDGKWAKAVLKMPLDRGAGFDSTLAAAFAFSKMYSGHQAIPMLVSSRREDDAELNEFKAGFQRTVMFAIVLLGLGVASLIAMIAVQAHNRQQRITAMILEEGSGDDKPLDQWRTDVGERHSKRRVLLQGLILFLIIMGAFASIAVLIDTLRWYNL